MNSDLLCHVELLLTDAGCGLAATGETAGRPCCTSGHSA